ncbi:MAG: hypothetical protein NTZ98_11935 [Acidobacteria bacterium]|nr:hypothetical protein [Acidobacteriota bacterium]
MMSPVFFFSKYQGMSRGRSDLEHALGASGLGRHRLAVGHRHRQRLLGIEVLAGAQNGDVDLAVGDIRRGQHHRVDAFLLIEHLAEVGVSLGRAAGLGHGARRLVGAVGQNVADGHHLHASNLQHLAQ